MGGGVMKIKGNLFSLISVIFILLVIMAMTGCATVTQLGTAAHGGDIREVEEKQYKKFYAKDEKPTPSVFEEKPIIKSDIDELPAIKAKSNKNSYAIVIGI